MNSVSRAPSASSKPVEAELPVVNTWCQDAGREYVAIENVQELDPFFLNIVSAGNHWFFCTSNGALSAGRRSPETALFPYYTVDKIIDNWNSTGPWTAIIADGTIWNPFRHSIALTAPISRRLLKSPLGDEVVFDEAHHDLGLRFTYRWELSSKYGFVRRASIENTGRETRSLQLVDGIDNFLAPGIDSRMQLTYSCLADAYKISELECGGSLVVHRLAAGIIDQPIPLESLKATTVWTHGFDDGQTFMSRQEAENFLRGKADGATGRVRANRGALLLGGHLTLEPGARREWLMVADIEQTQAQVSSLECALSDPAALISDLESDVAAGRQRLRDLVAAADGFQQTADRDTALYHYHNTLCNILRGGLPDRGYTLQRDQIWRYLGNHNRPLRDRHAAWLQDLPETISRREFIAGVQEQGDRDLTRLAEEYLPLILSRRHGDPSRPWNKFFIRLRDDQGRPVQHYEGNWRDIFQNWEALAWSYPDYLDGFITKFLNASTIDGYNPYRLTSEGIDWEVPDPEDPWASIGYWGDHQIIYLLKFLELEDRVRPEGMVRRLDVAHCVFADVPYRLKGWKDTLRDPRDTVDFDFARHGELMARKEQVGGDGLLLRDPQGELVRVTMAEKLLLPALTKLTNLVPGGGVWMNTQRPEWNDANNALAGNGLSVVTAAYLYRYLRFLKGVLSRHESGTLTLTPALTGLIRDLDGLFAGEAWQAPAEPDPATRFALVQRAGQAGERYRAGVYNGGAGGAEATPLDAVLSFIDKGLRALENTLRQNKRPDGLWHAYNVLAVDSTAAAMSIQRLPEMLEGQVAILSAGILNAEESLTLLDALPGSKLWSERHGTYQLYPDKELPRFLEKNLLSPEAVEGIPTLATMIARGDQRIVVPDPKGGFRFHPDITNAYALSEALDGLEAEGPARKQLKEDHPAIEALYEETFHHSLFTGRSGSMFGYEGLGCIYWHMVSKLMLAAQEVTLDALENDSREEDAHRLISAYYGIQAGLGFRQQAESYGAFPAEPYSHSPAHAGAQQPGLTGQVKEGLLCRFGELGIDFHEGRLCFRPRLLRQAEFAGLPGSAHHEDLPAGTITFTLAQTTIAYHRRDDLDNAVATVYHADGSTTEWPTGQLDVETTAQLTGQTGKITRIEVGIPSHWLIA